MKLIEILPNIYGVKVPIESENHHIAGGKLIHEKRKNKWESFMFLDGNYKILGTLTKDEISFDASELYRDTLQFHQFGAEQTFRSALPREIKQNEKLLILQKI